MNEREKIAKRIEAAYRSGGAFPWEKVYEECAAIRDEAVRDLNRRLNEACEAQVNRAVSQAIKDTITKCANECGRAIDKRMNENEWRAMVEQLMNESYLCACAPSDFGKLSRFVLQVRDGVAARIRLKILALLEEPRADK